MKKITYTIKQKKRASTLLALCFSELEAAEFLVANGLPREAITHLYFSSFYASHALLINKLKTRPSHKSVEGQLHKFYKNNEGFPKRYVDLHSFLHKLRGKHSYKETHIPSPKIIETKLRILQFYVNFIYKHLPKVETLEIIDDIYQSNKNKINDFSYDIYCPKTYFHHSRITFWQPPFYRKYFSPNILIKNAKKFLKNLRVKKASDYVVGLNSRLDQYNSVHLLMLDIDSLDNAIEAELKKIGGIIFKSGRGFHFIGKTILVGQKKWESEMRRIKRHKILKNFIDQKHIDISLKRGYSTLRITASKTKPRIPVFYKEF